MKRLALLFMLVLLSCSLYAQFNNATITGRVTDFSKAVVTGARIDLINTDTNVTRRFETDGSGAYYMPSISPGNYRIEVEKQGFKSIIKPAIVVHVQDALEINFELAVGATSESITVEGGAPLLQTESSVLGSVTTQQTIVSLPLANRNFTQILALAAGTSVDLPNAGELGKNNQNISTNGGKGAYNSFEFNGVDANNLSENSASGFGPQVGIAVPAPDTIQEFKVQTGMYDASHGRSVGASVELVSKSGTNSLHGALWEFFRNDAMNANDYFLKRNGQPRPVLKQNQFGFTLGGPIKKNRTFFFVSMQETIQRNGETALSLQTTFLPPLTNDRSRAALGSLFAGQRGYFQNLFGGVGPAIAADGSNINPVAYSLLNAKLANGQYLIPTPQTILPSGLGEFSYSAPSHYSEDQFTLNLDHLLTEKNQISGRFFYSRAPQRSPFTLGSATVPGWGQHEDDRNGMYVLSDTHTFSATKVNVARFAYMRFYGFRTSERPITNADIGMTSPGGLPEIPQISISGLFTLGSYYPLFREATNSFSLQDTFSIVLGRHAIRFGGEFKRHLINTDGEYVMPGALTFLSFPDFLLGLSGAQNGTGLFSNVYAASIDQGLQAKHTRYPDFSGFVQDDIKATDRLTINLGLRYEFYGPATEIQGRIGNFDPSLAVTDPPSTGTLTGIVVPANFPGSVPEGVLKAGSSSFWNSEKTDFAPRVGFAYRPFRESGLVVRGGYGIFYQQPSAQGVLQSVTNQPFVLADSRAGVGNAASTLEVPFNPPVPPISAFPLFFPRFASSSDSPTAVSRKMRNPYVQQYSLGIQYGFLRNFLLELGYVGSKATHLPAGQFYNQALLASPQNPVRGETTNTLANVGLRTPYQGIGPYASFLSSGYFSNYNSLQTSLTKRFSHGLSVLATYTWSKALGETGNGLGDVSSLELSFPTGDQTNPRQAYGPLSFDRTHRFIMSFVYETPKLSSGPKFSRALLAGWQVSGITTLQSGLPFTVMDSTAGSIYGATAYLTARAECTGASQVSNGSVADRLTKYFNPAGFTTAPAIGDGTGYGNCGVGTVRGFDQRNLDLAIQKSIKMPHETNLLFRTEFFNFTNTPKFGTPAVDRAQPSFGAISNTVSNPRIMQLALKYIF